MIATVLIFYVVNIVQISYHKFVDYFLWDYIYIIYVELDFDHNLMYHLCS